MATKAPVAYKNKHMQNQSFTRSRRENFRNSGARGKIRPTVVKFIRRRLPVTVSKSRNWERRAFTIFHMRFDICLCPEISQWKYMSSGNDQYQMSYGKWKIDLFPVS
jgi:hypothetical protein